MDSITAIPESQRSCPYLGNLREHLDDIDSLKRDFVGGITKMEVDGFVALVKKLRLVSLKLNEAQTALREVFGSLARPLLRPLKIHNLPDALLVEIFLYLNNLADVKNLRLSSRRLNKTSSHLLLHTLHVNLSVSSLLRLDKASRHPYISKGIRRIVASVDLYKYGLTKDFKDFAVASIRKLEAFLPQKHYPTHLACERILESWEVFLTNPDPLVCDGQLEALLTKSHLDALYSGYLQYYQLYLEQQGVLCDGHFAKAIAAAIGRLPNFKELVIRDWSHKSNDQETRRRPRTPKALKELVGYPDLLVGEMMVKTSSWNQAEAMIGHTSIANLLYQIPLAIHGAGSRLAHLKVDLTPFHSFHVLDRDEISGLKSFAQGLQSFRFRIDPIHPEFWRQRPEETASLSKFLVILTRSKQLNVLALDLAFRERDLFKDNRTHDVNRTSIGPLLVSLRSPKLEKIHLQNCSLHLKDLQALVDHLRSEQAVIGLWYVSLLSGDWAEAVELLREKVLSGRLGRESYVRTPYGAECVDMSVTERKRLFQFRWDGSACKDNVVNCYIKGHDHGPTSNPLRVQDNDPP
ncbi:hypothetical protein diail_11543 [Diaporthe ilicicola]|nr:hypothetical protein diail_11543 [Diaporthe ilicicola]